MRVFLLGAVISVLCSVSRGFEDKTLPQYLADNGYTNLSAALQKTGLDTALAASGPFTIFAPNDAAFQKLGQSTLDSLTDHQLATILKYHVISEFVLTPMISAPTTKTTLEGQSMTIESSAGTLRINNASNVDKRYADIIVNNGAIQTIDSVLIPPVLPTENIAQILLKEDTRFKDLFLALLLADLVTLLQTGDYTVFAPVDSAFEMYKNNLLSPTAPNAQKVYQEVLKYHVVPGGRRASDLQKGQVLYTLHGTSVNVTMTAAIATVNNANIIDTDIAASNGVIHAIDHLLIPQDISQVVNGRR